MARSSIVFSFLGLLSFVILLINCVNYCAPNHVAVGYNTITQTVASDLYPEGFHLLMPWQKLVQYPTQLENLDFTEDTSITCRASDTLRVIWNLRVKYTLRQDALITLFRTVGADFEEYVKAVSVRAIRESVAQFTAKRLFNEDDVVMAVIGTTVNDALSAICTSVQVEQVSVVDIVSSDMEAAIDAEVTIRQKLRAKTAEIDTKKATLLAEALSLAYGRENTLTEAEGKQQAEITRLTADATLKKATNAKNVAHYKYLLQVLTGKDPDVDTFTLDELNSLLSSIRAERIAQRAGSKTTFISGPSVASMTLFVDSRDEATGMN